MEFLNFTFQSFWHFIGVFYLISTLTGILLNFVALIVGKDPVKFNYIESNNTYQK